MPRDSFGSVTSRQEEKKHTLSNAILFLFRDFCSTELIKKMQFLKKSFENNSEYIRVTILYTFKNYPTTNHVNVVQIVTLSFQRLPSSCKAKQGG